MDTVNYSIIIPHYSIPDLLLRCLRSVPQRDDVEIIVADDCSENFAICAEQFKAEFADRRIIFCSTDKHSGPGAARNKGLNNASGKWIVFTDADDFFSNETDEIFDVCADRAEDILFFRYRVVMSDDINMPASDYAYEDILEQYSKNHNDQSLRYRHYSVCGRLIKRSFIENNRIRFDERYHGEDLLFAVKMGHLCGSLDVLPYCLDVITSRPGSLSRSWDTWGDWYNQFFPAHIIAMHYLHKYGVKAIDKYVYGKLLTIMKSDRHTFRKMYRLLTLKEKAVFRLFLLRHSFFLCIKRGFKR